MRYWLLVCLALIFTSCTGTDTTPTLRGPVVPTRSMPSATPTPIPTDTPTATLTPSLTPTDTATATETATATSTVTETATATFTPTETATFTPTASDTPVPPSPTSSDTPVPPSPTASNTPQKPSPTPSPTASDTPQPSAPTRTPLPSFPPSAVPRETPVVVAPTPAIETPVVVAPTPVVGLTVYRSSTSPFEPLDITDALTFDTVLSGAIDDQHPIVLYTFTTPGDTVVDVELRAVEGDLDPYLIVLDPKGREIARNDDLDSSGPNSAIMPLPLREKGTYVIVATRVGQEFGETSGHYDIGIVTVDPLTDKFGTFSQTISYNATVNGALNDETPQQVYTFRGNAGDAISIQLTQTSGDLDPNVTLVSNLGTELAYNDDNLRLDTLDSLIQGYILPRTGYYSIVLGRFIDSENAGNYRLKFTNDSLNAGGVFAIIDTMNSRTLKDDGSLYTNFFIGDLIDDNNSEHTYQSLITYRLPTLTEGQSVGSAVFSMEPCKQTGGGFDALGSMTAYLDNYGDIHETRNISRPVPGARVLSVQNTCAPIDLTPLVQDAYANGDENVQLRLMFRNHTDNGDEDQVSFTPALLITFGS